jgi:PhnB protein
MMNTNLHLEFSGNCGEAFAFYEKTFGTKRMMTMTYGEAPGGSPVPEESKNLIMHTALPVGSITLMGADMPKGEEHRIGGFHVSLDAGDEADVKRLFAALSEGGSVQMPLAPTFWSPLFGMLKDRFGVGWMLSVTSPQS